MRSVELKSHSADEPCPSCGARLGGRQGCQEAFEHLSAEAWSSPVRAAVHNLVVDTYAMQHSEEYGRSAKSYVAHLTALCCNIEAPGNQALYWAIPRWLDGSVNLERPHDRSFRGAMTVADVHKSQREEEYPELVRRWAKDVWQAYAPQQGVARQWLEAVRLDGNRAGVERRR